jgi:hypothetical protein
MTAHTDLDAREALAERLVDDTTHALEMLSIYLGLELGLYQALNGLGAATEAEIAAATAIAPRYAREWLEQQAAAGYLACNDPERPAEQRRYLLPAFTAPGDPVERFMYGWSVLHCLPATMAERPMEATGTVLRVPNRCTLGRRGGLRRVRGPTRRQPLLALLPDARLSSHCRRCKPSR